MGVQSEVVRAQEAITNPAALDLEIAQARMQRDLTEQPVEQAEAEYTPRDVEIESNGARRVFAVDIRVPNRDRRLQPGLPARATIDTQRP